MLDWMFKKDAAVATVNVPNGQPPTTANAVKTAPMNTPTQPAPGAEPALDWDAPLQAALGDDAALMALARAPASPLTTKLAAVAGLTSEEALRAAEREFRSHDRRVHSLAKQRVRMLRAQRETRAQADILIAAAQQLASAEQIPVNSAVELDRAWAALDATLLDSERRAAFSALTEQLSALTRQRADQAAGLKRWHGDAQQALAQLQSAGAEAARGEPAHTDLLAVRAAVQAVAAAAPAGVDPAALQVALAGAEALSVRLAWLDQLQQGQPVQAEATGSVTEQWQALPPLPDSHLQAALQERFDAWQRAQEEAHQQRQALRREQAKANKNAVRAERAMTLESLLAQAETCLAEGAVAQTHQHLVEIDALLHAGAAAEPLRARITRLQDGYAELRGWQHWAGGRARDELMLEAEALAARCAPGADGAAAKLQIKAQGELITSLQTRWKELDRLGGAGSRALWLRFDAAMKTAYEPLAAHKAAQSAVREQNLAARQQLVQALEAVALPQTGDTETPAALRAALTALERFRVEWRKLGPLEHTVPQRAREVLTARMDSAVQRLQAPLDETLHLAQQERQALINRAQALATRAQEPAAGMEDPIVELRTLQTLWQQCAQALPLPRPLENTLWTRFRSALDAVFSARTAVFNAHDAELNSNAAARVALIESLESAGRADALTPRLLADIDSQWQHIGAAPRGQVVALEGRFRQARVAAQQWLAGSRQRSWQATCDALAAKLALCEARERKNTPADGSADTLAQDWAALPAVPEVLESALRQRAGLAQAAPQSGLEGDELLLQLEAAWNLPSPAAFAAARRGLQLQAMKAALETRRSPRRDDNTPTTPEQWLAAALQRPGGTSSQRERLAAVLLVLRQRGPA